MIDIASMLENMSLGDFLFIIVFPLVLLLLLLIIFISGLLKKKIKRDFMSLDEFIMDWLRDHGQAHKLDDQFAKMRKDPAGRIYMPITYHGAKFAIKCGLTPNKVSYINLILSFLIFYGVIMASRGHTLDLFTQQPYYGVWFIPLAFLALFTGIIDGIDGAIARLTETKSRAGAWLDNVIDRISDILLLVCLVPTSFLVFPEYGLDFTWIIWTNIFLIFLYEYMRSRHEGLGLHEAKPFVGERITRFFIIFTFFLIYGISSFFILITNWIDPSATKIWAHSHGGTIKWNMLIFQINLLLIMVFSSIKLAQYSLKNLKKLDGIK
ncbi:MAG: CDP-alcohol phosphatidyltransferase family protein [Promethearchaeota archaeon]|nr:MAG: CDP-alcohol phosphatidyltransferase family protein [Candidatus Lokiarchaeota archaeon]